MSTAHEAIKTYVDYHRGQARLIAEISAKYKNPEDNNVQTYQKILFLTLLDAPSKSVYPKKENNRERFVAFIREFAGWDHMDRISLTHIVQLGIRRPEPEYEKLRTFALERLKTWIPDGRLIWLDNDPEQKEVEPLWPHVRDFHDSGKKDWRWERFQHAHLLYQLRNSFIHEFRKLGIFPHEAEIDQERPYYMHYKDLPEPTDNWTLCYPRTFLRKLCETSLGNLEAYLTKNQLDPSLHYSSGDFWAEELN